MKTILISLLYLISLSAFAQSNNGSTIPPRGYNYNLDQLPEVSDSLNAQRNRIAQLKDSILSQRQVIKTLKDSLSLRPRVYEIYNRQQSDSRYEVKGSSIDWVNQVVNKPMVYPSTIGQIPHLFDSLAAKLSRSEYQAFASGVASSTATYNKQEANSLFAQKGTSLRQYNILDAYRKSQVDSSMFLRTIKYSGAVKGDGVADDTQAIQAQLNDPGPGGAVFFPAGAYRVSGPLFVGDGVRVEFSSQAEIAVAATYANTQYLGNDAGYVFVLGNGSQLIGARIDIRGFATGGISMIQRQNARVAYCTVKNWTGVRFGIAMVGAVNCRTDGSTLTDGVHGINAFRSVDCHAHHNWGNRLFSFIYGVAATGMEMNNNVGYNCEDVVFDFEKGVHCHGSGNYAEAAKNGEYAIFDGGVENAGQPTMNDVVFSNSTAVRRATYQKANATGTTYVVDSVAADRGACAIWSLPPGATNVGFDNMNIYVERGYAFTHPQVGDKSNRQVFFRNNRVRSKAGFVLAYDSDGLQIVSNYFEGLPGSEDSVNTVRDAHAGVIKDNTFTYVNPKRRNAALYLWTSSNFATAAPLVSQNTFINTNTRALQISHFQNGSLGTVIHDNTLSTTYVPNGGLEIENNGPAVLRNQNLKILLNSGSNNISATVTGLSRSGFNKAFGNLGFGRTNYNGLAALVAYMYGGGTFVSVLGAANGLTASVENGAIVLGNQTGSTINGYLDLTVNSY